MKVVKIFKMSQSLVAAQLSDNISMVTPYKDVDPAAVGVQALRRILDTIKKCLTQSSKHIPVYCHPSTTISLHYAAPVSTGPQRCTQY